MTMDATDSQPTRSKSLYLLLDDHAGRTRQFREGVSGDGLIIEAIAEAVELGAHKDDLEVLDGVIVDFHLNTPHNPDYAHLHYPCATPICPNPTFEESANWSSIERDHAEHEFALRRDTARAEHARQHEMFASPVKVTTGLGAMLYVRQHAPEVALYGICELNAPHSLLFLPAAYVWLGAGAINAEYPHDQIRKALTSEEPEELLPINRQLQQAADGFTRLTNSLDFLDLSAEAFDWLDEFRFCPKGKGTHAEFKRRVKQRFGRRTLESDIYIEVMCRWQGALARIFKAFNKDVSGWPSLQNVTSVKHWDANNPVLDFLQQGHFQTFFTDPDVRAALKYYRAEQQRTADDSADDVY